MIKTISFLGGLVGLFLAGYLISLAQTSPPMPPIPTSGPSFIYPEEKERKELEMKERREEMPRVLRRMEIRNTEEEQKIDLQKMEKIREEKRKLKSEIFENLRRKVRECLLPRPEVPESRKDFCKFVCLEGSWRLICEFPSLKSVGVVKPSSSILALIGEVKFEDIEGGCFYLENERGQKFELQGVSKERLKELVDKKVIVKGKVMKDKASLCQIGPIIEVRRISLLLKEELAKREKPSTEEREDLMEKKEVIKKIRPLLIKRYLQAKEEREKKLKAFKAKLREKVKQMPEEKKMEILERFVDRLNNLNLKLTDTYLRYVNSLDKISEKLIQRAEKVEEAKGIDLSEFKSTVQDFRADLLQAREDILAQQERVYQLEEGFENLGETLRSILREFREDHKELREMLRGYKRNLVEVVKSFKEYLLTQPQALPSESSQENSQINE